MTALDSIPFIAIVWNCRTFYKVKKYSELKIFTRFSDFFLQTNIYLHLQCLKYIEITITFFNLQNISVLIVSVCSGCGFLFAVYE